MRVLFLCHRIPYPPDKGDKIRAFHEVRALATRHEVDLFTLADSGVDMSHRSSLAEYCREVRVARLHPTLARLKSLPYLLTRTPLTVPYFYSAELQKEVRRALARRSYDRVIVYSSAMAQYLEWGSAPPVITDLVDVDSDKWFQYADYASLPFSAIYRREGRALRTFERMVCQRSTAIVVTTEKEAEGVRNIWAGARVHVIPNGVDVEHFSPAQHCRPPEAYTSEPTVVFTGDMAYFPNEEGVVFFAEKVLPLILQELPTVRFMIVGRNPSRKVRGLAKHANIEVTGWVQDVRPYLAASQVSIAPLSIATGIQNKILEAMACGLPVVATSRATQGLSSRVAQRVDTGSTPMQLAEHVLRLLSSPELAKRRGLDGRRQVSSDYSWEKALDLWNELVEHPNSTSPPVREPAAFKPAKVMLGDLKR